MKNFFTTNLVLQFLVFSGLVLATRTAIAADVVLPVPEPGVLALFTAGAAAIALVYRNRRK
jgi:hypothetical protein